MKITALLVLKCNPEGSDPTILANASDVTRFGYFQRPSVREFIVFVGRTVGKRTPPGQRQSVQHEEYKVHSYNRNGLCTVGFMDDHYPVRSAFSLLNKVQVTCYFQGYSLGGLGAEGLRFAMLLFCI
ncbi:VAMP-like protein YKT61 isoform X4 [Camellia sinensis]|uniref:VAMP-like protein YKT61 isoform X4 n=1 Tax=Camellia sinensis TaxID=4442 RepID=UPI001036BF71|nr:VAMP-like protein YKT61 isoform X4 [Camellia sinensis]